MWNIFSRRGSYRTFPLHVLLTHGVTRTGCNSITTKPTLLNPACVFRIDCLYFAPTAMNFHRAQK